MKDIVISARGLLGALRLCAIIIYAGGVATALGVLAYRSIQDDTTSVDWVQVEWAAIVISLCIALLFLGTQLWNRNPTITIRRTEVIPRAKAKETYE